MPRMCLKCADENEMFFLFIEKIARQNSSA